MAKEEISFVLNSNLDKIANHAKILSQNVEDLHQAFKRKNTALIEQNKLESIAVEGIKKLADNYSKLNDNVSGVINSNKNFVNSFSDSAFNLSIIDSLIEKLNKRLSDVTDGVEIAGNKWRQVGPNTWEMNIPSNKLEEESKSTFRKIGDFIHDVVKNILDSIHKIGAQLAVEAMDLKPFALEFMNTFSFNPLKFFGFGAAMKESFNLILKFQQMRHELAYLSDSSGDASKALGLVYEIAGGSAVASGTAQGIIRALADQGIIANKELKSIGILSGNLQAATGIAASQWASFTGELAFNYGIPTGGLENITSALIGTNIRGAQLEKVMGTVNKVLQTTGFIAGVPTTESVHKLTKSIGGASKTFQSLGISAEKSGAFIEGIMDPENFEKNAFMFAKLGISASEYAGYLNDADGQQKLLQKTMQNLPALAGEIANIQNPFARIQYAKTIGLDMQIVQRMAGKTKADIEQILADYEKENKGKEALEAKKQKMAAESAKFDDMMLALKLKVLAPVMKFLSSGYLDRFFSVLPQIAETIGSIFKVMTPIIEEITRIMLDAVPLVSKLVDEWVIPFIKDFPEYLKTFLGLIGINEKDTESNGAQVLKYLAIVAGVLAGWKTFTFISDMIGKVTSFFNPRKKTVMAATVGDLADAIADSMRSNRPDRGGLSGTMSTVLRVASAAVAAYATYKVASSVTEGAGGTKSISERVGGKLGLDVFFKVAGEKGLELIKNSYEKVLEYGSKSLNKMSSLFDKIITPFTNIMSKTSNFVGNMMSKITTPIGNLMSKIPGVKPVGEFFSKIASSGGGFFSKITERMSGASTRLLGEGGLKGAVKGGLKAAGSWKTLGAGFLGGIASEEVADLMGGNEAQKKAAKNTGSTLSSTAAAFTMAGGGPQGLVAAGINMAIEGGLRGFEESNKINKLVKDKIGPSITDPLGDPNMLDDIANKLQGGLGGALTLGLGFIFDDVSTMITGEVSESGTLVTGLIGEKLVAPLRTAARAYDMTAGEYEMISNNFNQKFKMAGEEFNNNIKEGKYVEAFSDLGKMIGIKFRQYIITPFKQMLEGVLNFFIVLLAEFQGYLTKTDIGKKAYETIGLPDFQKMVKDKQGEQNVIKQMASLQQQAYEGKLNTASFKASVESLPMFRNLMQSNSSFQESYNDTLQLLQKSDNINKQQLEEQKKANVIAGKHLELDKNKKAPQTEVKTVNIDNFNFGKVESMLYTR